VNGRDPHSALKSDVIHRISKDGAEFVLARLQYGKTDIQFSLHASPNTFQLMGYRPQTFYQFWGFSALINARSPVFIVVMSNGSLKISRSEISQTPSPVLSRIYRRRNRVSMRAVLYCPGTKAMPISAMGQARARIGDHDCYPETVTPHKKSRE
jgi:hypothetical protein